MSRARSLLAFCLLATWFTNITLAIYGVLRLSVCRYLGSWNRVLIQESDPGVLLCLHTAFGKTVDTLAPASMG